MLDASRCNPGARERMSERPVAPAHPSATILLVRDGSAGLEVFMVERHHRIDFATGALVFPGGKVDPGDSAAALRERCAGAEGLDHDTLTVRVAAIRETFEEAGVLLARGRGEAEILPAERLAGIEERHRRALEADAITIGEVAEAEDLELACDRLVPFAHWITPSFMPKRFDTWFFLVAAPPDHVALHDGRESVDSVWTTPAAAVAAAEHGERTIIFPTLMNLRKLGRSERVEDALAAARRAPVVTVFPRMEKTPAGRVVRIPPEAGYGLSEIPAEELT